MKKLIFLLSLVISFGAMAQTVGHLRYDTVKIYKVGDNAELVLQNATKDSTKGVLTNMGNGRTAFVRTRKLNDSTIVIGGDTLTIPGNGGGGGGGGEGLNATLALGNTATSKQMVWNYTTDVGADAYFFKWTTSNDNTAYPGFGRAGSFYSGWQRFDGVNASGRPNVVGSFFSYNASTGGGRIYTDEASARFALETNFDFGAGDGFEVFLPEVITEGGTTIRPLALYINKTTAATQYNFGAVTGVLFETVAGVDLLQFNTTGDYKLPGSAGTFTLYNGTVSDEAYQLQVTNTEVYHNSFGLLQQFDGGISVQPIAGGNYPFLTTASANGGWAGYVMNGSRTGGNIIPASFEMSSDASIDARIINTNTGTSADARWTFGNGTNTGQIIYYSTTSSIDPNRFQINNDGGPVAVTSSTHHIYMAAATNIVFNPTNEFRVLKLAGSGTGFVKVDNDGDLFFAAGATLADGTYGDITVSSSGTVFTESDPLSWKLTGTSSLTGTATIDGAGSRNILFTNTRVQTDKGADITAANSLTLGGDGNVFTITGNTQINAITTANWQAGSPVTLIFSGTPTVKHNTAGGGGTATLLLGGGVDFVAAAGDALSLVYDGTNWHETNRKVVATPSSVRFGVSGEDAAATQTRSFSTQAGSFTFTKTGAGNTLNISATTGIGLEINATTGTGLQALTTGLNYAVKAYAHNTGTNNTIGAFQVVRTVSGGTAAAGVGGNIDFAIQNNAGSLPTAAKISAILTDVTNGAEYGSLDFYAMYNNVNVKRVSVDNGLTIWQSATIPSTSAANGIRLYSEDVAGNDELKVRDEAGNIATLSPHNFTGIPHGPSEPMAWAFYSERDGTFVNVDMLKLARWVEKLSGEKLVWIGQTKDLKK